MGKKLTTGARATWAAGQKAEVLNCMGLEQEGHGQPETCNAMASRRKSGPETAQNATLREGTAKALT